MIRRINYKTNDLIHRQRSSILLFHTSRSRYQAQYQMMQQQQQQQQQQAAHYDMNAPSTNFQTFDYTLIQPQS
jgi:hypothetical protein